MKKLGKIAFVTATGGGLLLAGAGGAMASIETEAAATGSPGVVSGNNIQVPISVPINLCGNTIDVVGILNPAFGNYCQNGDNEETHVSQHSSKHHGGGHHGGARH